MKRLTILFIVLMSLVLLAGCQSPRTRVIALENNIYGTPPLESVETSIIRGASNAGWAVNPEPGVVYAAFRLSSRPYGAANETNSQNAVYERNTEITEPFYTDERIIYVAITYDVHNYRIEYADSKNMGFEPESDSINNIYQPLVKKLDRSIQAELVAAY